MTLGNGGKEAASLTPCLPQSQTESLRKTNFLEQRIMRISHGGEGSLRAMPLGNYIIMLVASIFFMIQFNFDADQRYLGSLILEGWSLPAMAGYLWLHTGVVHIISNLATLWIFGRYVCRRMGTVNYILAYLFAGFTSAVFHIIYDGRPAIGASGAIMGVLGLHVVLCFNRLGVWGPWLVLAWYLANMIAGALEATSTAHMAHIGGFLGGILLAWLLVLFKVVEPEEQPEPPPPKATSPFLVHRKILTIF